jgi:hypothetical protein
VIHRLRRRHRRIWLALALLLPLLYVLALAARRPSPVIDSLPEPLRAPSASAELAVGESAR